MDVAIPPDTFVVQPHARTADIHVEISRRWWMGVLVEIFMTVRIAFSFFTL
ncbi:hypothetical protein BGLA2_1110062 [Burkholderia gladioli]|nr:hypothetical protein BGLA2_1110062 [Burkholderia gladioli]